MSIPFTLPSTTGAILHGLVDLPASPLKPKPYPTVVICHGFKGFLDWGFFPPLAELLAERGFAVVRFNFSGAGQLPGEDQVTDPAAFRANTYSRERDDLLSVLDGLAAIEQTISQEERNFDLDRISLLGHSRGGGDVLLAAAHPRWRDSIRALVTWASISTVDRVSDAQREIWRRDGELITVNSRTGQRLAIGVEVLDDVELHAAELDLRAAAAVRTAPWRIVHGSDDESVPAAEAEALFEVAREPRELVWIEGGSHTFGARHPFAGPTPQLIQAMNATQEWLIRFG